MTRAGTAFAVLLALAVVVAPALAKDEPATVNDEANAFAKVFKKSYKKQTSAEVIEGVDKLVGYYKDEKVDDKKARKAIIECLKKASTLKDNVVVSHIVTKCGELDDGVLGILLPTLARALKMKPPNDVVYEAALEALGKLRSENGAAIKQLKGLLMDKDDSIVGHACRAIAGYGAASGKVRKDLFEAVLKATEGTYSGFKARNPPSAEVKWNIISGDVAEAFSKLSGSKISEPRAAREYFNQYKKRSWERKKK